MDIEKNYFQAQKEIEKNYSPEELLEIFPEAKKIIPIKLREWQEKEKQLIEEFRKILREIKNEYKQDRLFRIFLLKDIYKAKIKRINRHIYRLNSYLCDGKEDKGRITTYQIEKARQIHILDVFSSLYDGYIKKSGKNYSCLCPFHQEKNPSFYIFPETNTFYCFGCGEKGDVIDLVKKMKKVNFKKAVKFLLKGGNGNGED